MNHKPPQADPKDKQEKPSIRFATDKQVDFIKDQIRKKGIPEKDFFEAWKKEFKAWDKIPFDQVNPILAWIREQKAKKK